MRYGNLRRYMLTEAQKKELRLKANEIRTSIVEMLVAAGSGHSAGPLGLADIFSALYFNILKHDPKNPAWPDRDRLIVSNGHVAPVLYAAMAHAGYLPVSELTSLRKSGSRLQGHPHREFLPMLETSSGPLGSGLSQAVGMALADRMDHGRDSHKYFYCVLSDAELQEGATWEAAMLAGKERLRTLTAVVDRNSIQIGGYTEDLMPVEPLRAKWEAFNWYVVEIDGHDFDGIAKAFDEAKAVFDKPTVIIAHTIPGKGVDFMERDYKWHGEPPKGEEAKRALEQLRTLGGRIEGGDI